MRAENVVMPMATIDRRNIIITSTMRPRPVYVEHHYRPVVVERHVYHPPVAYYAPAPSGYFFGMSVMEPGMAFSFGVGGH